jgi:hypothetical protein
MIMRSVLRLVPRSVRLVGRNSLILRRARFCARCVHTAPYPYALRGAMLARAAGALSREGSATMAGSRPCLGGA